MRLFLFDWFGWSLLWILPLAGRLLISLLAGRGLRGRGSIRLWLGTLMLLCGSSVIEALLRSQGNAVLETDLFGQALARGLSGVAGKLMTVLAMLATAVLGGFWLFGRSRQAVEEDDNGLPAHASVPRRTQVNLPPIIKNLPAVAGKSATPPRKRDPWPLPNEMAQTGNAMHKPAGKWPQANSPTTPTENRPARPASEWAAFERLRPTNAMLARASAEQTHQVRQNAPVASPKPNLASSILSKPQPIATMPPSVGTKVRISTASNRNEAIPTSLSSALNARLPQAPLPIPVAAVAPVAAAVSPTQIAALLIDEAPSSSRLPEPEVSPVASIAIEPEPFRIIDRQEPVTPPLFATMPPPPAEQTAALLLPPAAPVPMQIRTWTAPPSTVSAPAPVPAYRAGAIPLPGLDLLDQGSDAPVEMDANQLLEIGQLIEQRLREFKVPVTVLGAYAGPVITRFEIEPALGVRGAQIVNLMKDLARALGLTSIRVVETIPGKTCMGLELPNPKRQMIRLAEIIRSDAYTRSASHLTLAMGKDITGIPIATDLARAPHMLVAGTTGSGKSVAINAMILSLLYKATPDDVRLIMIDPKMLELSVYDGIPHLLAPVVIDMKLAAHALSWCVAEMDKRYRLMSALGVRNLAGYNQKISDGIAAEKLVKNPFSLTPDAPEPLDRLPMIVVVIDELADLMMVAGKKIEELIARLAQKARAAGIHLILATQRPSVDVITGLIKANIPTRVAFQVSSKIDSRTVLDQMGAETLLGHGDMLFLPPGSGYPQRVHGAFVSDEEVHRVVEHLKAHGEPQYEEAILAGPASEEQQQGDMFGESSDEADPLYDEAVAYVTRSRRASISSVQRQFRIGYNRAARLVEQMEAAGILSAMSRGGARDVLAPPPADL